METAKRILGLLVQLAILAALSAVAYEVFTNGEQFKQTQRAALSASTGVQSDIHQTSQALIGTASTVDTQTVLAVQNLDSTLDAINRPCSGPTKERCGTLADLDQSLRTIRGTFGQIEVAARHENANLTSLDRQETQLFSDTHVALGNLNDAFGSANDTLNAGTRSFDDLDGLLKDPGVHQTITNVDGITGDMHYATTDFRTRFHDVLFPPPCKTAGCRIARAWPVIHGGLEMAEPSYYLYSLWKGIPDAAANVRQYQPRTVPSVRRESSGPN